LHFTADALAQIQRAQPEFFENQLKSHRNDRGFNTNNIMFTFVFQTK